MKRTRKRERKQHLRAWRECGLSKTKYCRQNGLHRGTFYRWFREQRKEEQSRGGFIEITAQQFQQQQDQETLTETTEIGIILPNGYRMNIGKGFDPETFVTALTLLEAR